MRCVAQALVFRADSAMLVKKDFFNYSNLQHLIIPEQERSILEAKAKLKNLRETEATAS